VSSRHRALAVDGGVDAGSLARMVPFVTRDPDTGYAYIYLEEPRPGMVDDSVPLDDVEGYEALASIVLDLGADGRLVGIEVLGDAREVLRPAALATAVAPSEIRLRRS
jgi:uncharacterized protein YuzE